MLPSVGSNLIEQYIIPYGEYPSCLHTTLASLLSQKAKDTTGIRLATRKVKGGVQLVFHGCKKEALKCGVCFSPDEIMTDFELAMVQSLELEFPGARIHGCYFLLYCHQYIC